MSADSVLDVGCGTGALLHRAWDEGHRGRLCGIDPARGMLAQARKRPEIEWVLGDLATTSWNSEFGLIVMSGHAFQLFVQDDELRTALAAIRSALTPDGRFTFETRNPLVHAWENWGTEYTAQVTDSNGAVVRAECDVEMPVDGDLVRFSYTFTSPNWRRPQISRSTLRFLDADSLSSFLSDAGLVIEEQFGDWDRSPLTDISPEIITIARRAAV
jgi:ubiquinone/menaquinone biosynthesis C-methylase UbiE